MSAEQWIFDNIQRISEALERQRKETAIWADKKGLDLTLLLTSRRSLSEMTLCPAWDYLEPYPEGFEMVTGLVRVNPELAGYRGHETEHVYLVSGTERMCIVPGIFVLPKEILPPGLRLAVLRHRASEFIQIFPNGVGVLFGERNEIADRLGIHFLP